MLLCLSQVWTAVLLHTSHVALQQPLDAVLVSVPTWVCVTCWAPCVPSLNTSEAIHLKAVHEPQSDQPFHTLQ